MIGSSPLARGLRQPGGLQDRDDRIIPARAGFTRRSKAPPREEWDHPRSRGVYTMTKSGSTADMGSSPLARGLPLGYLRQELTGRIIPARAGFTRSHGPGRGHCRDHPRSRGVYFHSGEVSVFRAGSSPLARGLHLFWDEISLLSRIIPARAPRGLSCPRIIPARAGFTGPGSPRRRSGPDHPRSRGVYRWRGRGAIGSPGSSPLARGLPVAEVPAGGHVRIIPARAGFTPPRPPSAPRSGDHPRSRGVYLGPAAHDAPVRGSSPLARGLPDAAVARAGRTEDHPRSRGVYVREAARLPARAGIIPARAGFTLADPWNPNEPVLYQTPAAFTADLGPAPPSCGSAVVVPRWTTTPSGA